MTVAVINSGGANLGSVVHALRRLGVECTLTRDLREIRSAERVILPGVGSAGAAMAALRDAGLLDGIVGLTQPVLGICLGLQLLFEHSEEGDAACLGIMPGTVTRLAVEPGLRLPHMGWNQVEWNLRDDPLAAGLSGDEWFYFVHSFAAPIDRAVATCRHGQRFAAIVRHNNFAACQFHPEKSAAAGARILENFLRT
ncbi:MAG: imidazole glycerol phosphate synthase subunit HisH [Wenzhouxiangella sp.]|jgi:glutamine amidotransferase|nr:imidazole glycerol phosphate synthase subunit HisH [Wenzhouxiangella sp.]